VGLPTSNKTQHTCHLLTTILSASSSPTSSQYLYIILMNYMDIWQEL
jgi:hypothetical protein